MHVHNKGQMRTPRAYLLVAISQVVACSIVPEPSHTLKAEISIGVRHTRVAPELPFDSLDRKNVAILIISSSKSCESDALVLKTCGAGRLRVSSSPVNRLGVYASAGHCIFGDLGKHAKQRIWLAQSIEVARRLLATHSRKERTAAVIKKSIEAIEAAAGQGEVHELNLESALFPRQREWQGVFDAKVEGDVALLVDTSPFAPEEHIPLPLADRVSVGERIRLPAVGTNDCITKTTLGTNTGWRLDVWDDPLIGQSYGYQALEGNLAKKPHRESFTTTLPAALQGTFAFDTNADALRLWDHLGEALLVDLGTELVPCSGESGLPWLRSKDGQTEFIGVQSLSGFIRLDKDYVSVFSELSQWLHNNPDESLLDLPETLFHKVWSVEQSRRGYAMLAPGNSSSLCKLIQSAQASGFPIDIPSACAPFSAR